MPRTWASGDNVFLPIGGLVGIGSSANTLVAIAKKASDSSWMTPTAIQPSAGNPTVSMQVSSTNKLSYVSGATDKDTGITWQSSDGWSLIAVDKDAGTATPNGHLYVYSTNTWTHSAAASTVGGNSTDLTGGKVQHGRWATGDPFIGDIAIAGVWKRQLTQTQIEYLAFSLQAWYASAPDYLVIFDQAATSQNVVDLITGNTEQSHSGAAVGTSSVPVFSYGFAVPVPSFVASAGGATDLVVQDATHAQSTDGVTLTQDHQLVVADAGQAQSTDPVALTQDHQLVVADAAQAQSTDPVTLTQVHVLAVQDATSAQTADNVTLNLSTTLVVQDAGQAHTADSPTLTQVHALAVQDALQAQTAESPTMTQVHALVVADALHAQLSDTVQLGTSAALAGEAHGPESLPTGAVTYHAVGLTGGVT